MNFKLSVIAISVHPEDDNPVFGAEGTHVRLADDGGGPFVVLAQSDEFAQNGQVRLDFSEIPYIVEAINQLKVVADSVK